MTSYDRRLHAFRPDLADARLEGRVDARRFVAGRPARISATFEDLRRGPDLDAPVDTQLLMGDAVRVFDVADGWAWVQADRDGYVGYLSEMSLAGDRSDPTHRVTVPRTFLYPDADLRHPSTGALSLGAGVTVVGKAQTRGTDYAVLDSGEAVIARHVAPVDDNAPDYVAVAESLLHTPYLWGGATGFGIDCSGLVQLSMHMAGRDVLRDTDMQASSIGSPFTPGDGLAGLLRGDLVYWAGHVAIMRDPDTIIHASGHTMMVTSEPLRDAVDRIGYLYAAPTAFRRP